jgi:tetratricopeptide (TPR) repeat protein
MEPGKQLDASGGSGRGRLILLLLFSLLLTVPPAHARAQDTAPASDPVARAKSLYDAGRFDDLVQSFSESPSNPPQLELYRGLAFSQLARWQDAVQAFTAGLARDPRQPRLLEELAGVEYKQKQFRRAKRHLRRALPLHPADDYASNFLASVYFQEGNLDAALKYWNRAGQPRLSDLDVHGAMRVDRTLLDRAFNFSLGSEWRWDQYLTTRARLEALGAFSNMRFGLAEQSDGNFQLAFDSIEREPLSGSKWQWLASLFRGLPYQTVSPEFYNLNHEALNWTSYYRWDDQKRRVHSEISAPLRKNPAWQYRFYFDARNENWNLADTLLPSAPPAPAWLNLETVVAGAELRAIPSGRWSWSESLEYSNRRLRHLQGLPPQTSTAFLAGGSSIAGRFRADHALVRFPERRFTLDSSASAEVGTFFQSPLGRYARLAGDLRSSWFPRARGDDYEMQGRLRAGRTFGEVPFDELFTLGFDRDNDLWMRGHPGLNHGQKGSAPLGRNYVLANWDVAKNVYSASLLTLALGPFVDSGKISDPGGYFGAPKWLWDTGVQAKIRVFGNFEFVLGYGKDLRTGRNSFFSTVSR